jgi:hypothetical protein
MKKSRFLAAVASGALATLAFAQVANADSLTQVQLRQSGVVAADYASQSCDQIPGGQPIAGRDGWVFVLPGNKGEFVSLDLLFRRPNGSTRTVHVVNPNDNFADGIISGRGTSKAYVVTPAGWKLLSGTAMITGSAPQGKFNLTHACPAPANGYPNGYGS